MPAITAWHSKLIYYILQVSKYHYGLTANDAHILAYEYATAIKKDHSFKLENWKRAGKVYKGQIPTEFSLYI